MAGLSMFCFFDYRFAILVILSGCLVLLKGLLLSFWSNHVVSRNASFGGSAAT